ncbi:wgr domain containing protein [Stylonychia lemnae]|uniref:Poly [ADP-ribose] polymerase n=1 Tax=Stylonychia lemnae TaxID=5949 RepID=A0A077ZW68_STYLE|nr:wgr domain containing protein [Stylonychia lemnae]|eukprot:CDW74195.1 wgr domain containing protein [Stylonychia lemnae]
MGACVNQYYIYPTYLALHPKFRDQMLTFYRLTAEENKEFQQLARRDYDAYKNKQPLAYEPEAIQPSQLIPIIPNSIFSNYSFNTATQITITPAQQFYNNLAYLNLYGLMSFMNSFKSMKLLKILVKEGLDINQKTLAGQTFFIELVSTIPNDDIQFTEYFEFLEQHNLDKSVTDQQGNNALLLSFQQNKIKIAEYLLTKNMDINATNKQIETLLILTVKKNDFDMAEYLLDKGSDPNIQDKMGRTALHYAVNNSSSTIDANFDMENLLISNNANVNLQDRTKRTPLHYAFVKIGQQSNQNQAMDPIETISSLCSVKDANPSIQDKYGKNVLHYAAQRGATISTLYLEKKGVDFHQKDAYGNTPLATAMLYNQVQYAIMLIKQGSNVNELVYPENRQAYLEYKKKIRESQMIDEDPDVSEPEAPVYNQNSIFGQQQYSLFGQQQYGYGQQQIFNAKQLSQPENMFKLAVQYQQLGLSYLILDYGFDLIMAMEDALKQQKFSLALTLLQKVSDNKAIQKSNQKNQNLFHILAINAKILNGMQNSKQLNRIYKQFKRREIDIAQKDILGRLPIHYAAINGAYSLLEIMLADACVQVDEVDSLGQTPLVLAIKGKNLRVNDNYHCFKILMNSQKVRQNIIYEEKYYDESNFQIYVPETLKVTPFNHLTRSIKFLEQNLAVSYLELFFASSSNLFDVFDQRDEQNRDPIMVLAQQNDYNCFKLIFKQIKVNMSKILPRYQGTIEPLPNKKEQTKNDLKKILENKDNQGKTSLQILITNCDSGTYDNYRFFLKLVSLGAEITSQNSDIKQIFDYQSKYPKSYIYRLIQKELKLNNLNKLPMLNINTQTNKKSEEKMIQLEDMMMIDTTQVDYLRDSERYLSELAQSQQIVIQKILPKPDKILGVDDKALTVEFENEDDIDSAYEANLIKIDLKKYGHSSRVYYKIQLLHDKVKNIYVVLTKWGMINAHDQGMCQKTPFQTKEKAVEEFLKIFKLKTSNNWADRENFQLPRAKGKYVYHKVSRQIFNYTDSLVPFIYKECAESQLEKDQQRFIKLIANIGMYSEVLKQKMINNNQLNLSNIKKEDILKGKDILEKIQELFKKAQVQYDEESTSENKYKEIVQLSSELYRTIPFCYSTELPEPICDQQQIDKFRNTLYDLLTLENSTKILMGAKYMSKQMSPLDYIYRSLGIDISYAEQDSLDYEIVKNYVVNTGQSYVNTYTINNIYKISRHQDEQNFQNNGFCNDPHRLLLFHGTGQQNLLSILSTGLKSSPLGVNQHGQAFGPGVYFSNMLDKSASYAVGTRYMELEDQEAYLADIDKDQPQYMERKYILICEVALGYILKQEQAQKTIIHSQYNYNYLQNYVANMAIGSQQQLREINQQVSKLKIVKVENNNQKKVDSDEDNEEVQDEDAKIEDEEVKAQKFDVNELSDEEQEGENEISKKRKLLGEKVNDTRTIRSRRMLEITNEKALPMFDTLWIGANQIPDPQFNLLLEDGSIIPQGRYVKVEQTVKKLEGQQYVKRIHQYTNAPAQSEFIVKNPERIKIRYIVELRSKTQAEKAKEVVQRTKINTDIIVE